jgi:hypothetical protein
MVQLLAKKETGGWVNIDLSDNLAISLNRGIEEIEDITQRRSGYSKTFVLPGTDNNEKFFASAFDVNITDFNSSLLVDCVIQEGGNDIFKGTMRLNKIFVTPNGNNYEVYILEDITSLSTALQDFTLCDLDFSDIDHEVNYDNIISTWNFTGGSYTNYSGTTGKVLYPLCNTGYDTNLGYGEWNFGVSGLTNSGTPLKISQFKPWFNAKYVLDKVFDRVGFTYTSEFFNSDYFKSIFVLGGTNDTSSTATIGDRPENQNFFNVRYDGPVYIYPPETNLAQYEYIVFNTEEYDYLQQYTLSNYPDSGAGTGQNFYIVPIDGTYQFRVRQTMFLYGFVIAPTYVNVVLRDIDTGTIKDSINNVLIPVGSPTTYDWLFSASLTQGERLAIQFNRVTSAGDPYNTIALNQEDSIYESFVSPPILTTIGDIKVSDNLLCMSGLNYLKNLLNLFNLTVITDGERNVKIEPYVNYLSSQSGTTLDWSKKLDYSQTYEIEPLDYSLNQQLNLTYTLGSDYLSQRHFENFDKIFGEKVYQKQSKLLTGELDIEVGFESMPCEAVGGSGTTMVVPSLYRYEPEQNIIYQPISNGMKIGFYCGLVPFYTASTDTSLSTYYILSGATSQSHNYYPAINHLSQLTNGNDFSDLNFQPSWDFFKSNADFDIYTENNIYRQFYKQYLDVLYSDDAKLFTGKFILTPEDIGNINFNDTVYFLNSAWRLYQIQDADITQKGVVTCKFLKEPYELGKITLVPPNYIEQSVTRPPSPTPTPTPVACNAHNCYISFNQDIVCDQTAPVTTLYSNCSTITNGCMVYTDSGCTTPVTVGRFIYPTSATPTKYIYVVTDTNGTIAQSLCS